MLGSKMCGSSQQKVSNMIQHVDGGSPKHLVVDDSSNPWPNEIGLDVKPTNLTIYSIRLGIGLIWMQSLW